MPTQIVPSAVCRNDFTLLRLSLSGSEYSWAWPSLTEYRRDPPTQMRPAAVFQHGMNVEDGQTQRLVGPLHATVFGPEEPIIGGHPEQAVVVLRQRPHKVGGLALLRGIGLETAVALLDQAAPVGADPQAAIARGQQTKNAVLSEGGRILMRKEMKARPVKAQQPAAGAHPKITVRSLGEGLHGLFRQAILRLPGPDRVVPLPVACRGCFH